MQPVEVKVGIPQSELYAQYEVSNAGQAAAAGCGAVPGLGIILAGVCGGIAGAADAGINASRAKTAEETVRPLKDAIVDVQIDRPLADSLKQSIGAIPNTTLAGVSVTKTVTDKAYGETFLASTAGSVMFVNVDYHLTKDFSTLEMSSRSLVYPRSAQARRLESQPEDPARMPNNQSPLAPNFAIYRDDFFYSAKLPNAGTDIPANLAAWQANNGQLMRASLQAGIAKLTSAVAEDLAGLHADANLGEVTVNKTIKAKLLANSDDGQLLRYPDGSRHFNTTAVATTALASAPASASESHAAAPASMSPTGAAAAP